MQAPFTTLTGFRAVLQTLPEADAAARSAAEERNGQLTKPAASLGRLEELAVWYAGWRGEGRPRLERPQVVIFAGNHGVAARGVSAFPPEVTAQMVGNFEAGGAAINQLCKTFGAKMSVVPLHLDVPTEDFTQGPAMTEEQMVAALTAGWQAVDPTADLFITGEMGIGNTTPAAAVACGLYGGTAAEWTGRGSGVDDGGLALKTRVVEQGLARHAEALSDPLEVLRCLGGRELAAMAGSIARARLARIPVILDGFICTASAAVLECVAAGALDHAVAGHVSREGAHRVLLGKLGKEPLLDLGLRLGEASGAVLALSVLKAAVECHSGMATFAEAGVSGG